MVKQTFTISIGFLLFLFIFIPTVQADNGKTYEVGTEMLEMKNEPASTAETIGLLTRGDKITIFEEKNGWVRSFYDGQEVWVAAHFLIPIETKNETVSEQDSNKKTKKTSKTEDKENATKGWKTAETPDVKSGSIEIPGNGPLSNYHIVIDPGHGGKDAGAISDGIHEKDLTLSTAKKVAEKLQQEGATVTLTRADDSYLSLDKRVQISNTNKTNVFISLHYNAFSDPNVGGINTFYYAGDEELELAKSIQSSLIKFVNLNNRGAKQADYYVLSQNSDVAILVELGFITNPEELEKIQTSEYQEKVSEGIASGLKDYFQK